MNKKFTSKIKKQLSHYPSANFSLPTPIQFLKRISAKLGINVYVKREDLTGFALGGNKIRKLDYLIGDAVQKKADVLITKSASSFSRNAAAACKAVGLKLHVFLKGTASEHNQHSQHFFEYFNAHLHYTPEQNDEILNQSYEQCIEKLKNNGKSVYELHPGGSDHIGTLGYIEVFDEIESYSEETGIQFSHIIHATGSSATQAGLLLGQNISGYRTQLLGFAIAQDTTTKINNISELAKMTAKHLDIQYDVSPLTIDDNYIGETYPLPTKSGNAAVQLFADNEGLLFDQVYTGKAAAGLIDYTKKGYFNKNDDILFIHTGGNGGMFY